uniref:Ovule protein n=2 Tax=Bursaphelenchus xylophilus TaxID=6326 RepID=A0A1I7SJY2_BURXY
MKSFLSCENERRTSQKSDPKGGHPSTWPKHAKGNNCRSNLTSKANTNKTTSESAARLKAAAIFKKSLEKTGKVDGRTAQKRKADNEEDTPLAKKQNLLTSTEKQSGRKNQKVVGQK